MCMCMYIARIMCIALALVYVYTLMYIITAIYTISYAYCHYCRFGMRSVIAEAHFDGSRNFIVLLGGLRRYILTHPDQCVNMHMYPRGHPSGRHSAIDWSKPDPVEFPNWLKLRGNEVIMQPGDLLYLPTYWIHYIISLNVNYQCNTRSGRTSDYDEDIKKCGF